MSDTSAAEYTLRIELDESEDDSIRWRAQLTPLTGDPFPLFGYGETGVEAAVEVVAHYISDPDRNAPCNICGEEREAKVHTDTELHPDDAIDGLTLHTYDGLED